MGIPVADAAVIEWALWYATQGHPVFPLHTPTDTGGCSCRETTCTDIGKHPRTLHGLNDATTDAKQIRIWWGMWPKANIGIRTGITFWVLDIDPRKEGDTQLYDLEQEHGPLPATPRAKTGGDGAHILFALPPGVPIRNKVNITPGIDVRGEGGYIVAAPSLHVSTKHYSWEFDLEETPLAQAPAWILGACQTTHYDAPIAPDAPIPDGKRNDTLSRMAFQMRKAGMSLKEIHTALDAVNLRCTPPLDAEELLLIVEGKKHITPDPILRPSSAAKNGQASVPKAWPDLTPATTILTTSHALPSWIIPGLVPEGLTIVGGLPKVAKSYFAYDIALACAGQGLGLGHFGVMRGRAAYFAIEDDAGDTQIRLRELRPGITSVPDLFFLHGDAVPSISEGLLEYLRLQVTAHDLNLVIIDPLSYVYDPPNTKQHDSFREAKDMLLPLRQLARELHFALIFVDHRRKQGKDDMDVFQTLYGSVAKYAVADALIMVVRRDDEVTLHCRGRKIKDQVLTCEFAFQQGQACWKVHAANAFYSADTLRAKIVQAFKDAERLSNQHNRPLKVSEVLDLAELEHTAQMTENVRVLMFRMYKAGELQKTDRGLFLWTGQDDSDGVVI